MTEPTNISNEMVRLAKELTSWIVEAPVVREFAFQLAAMATDRYTEWEAIETSSSAFLLEGKVRHSEMWFTIKGNMVDEDLEIIVGGFDPEGGGNFTIGKREFNNLGRSGASPVAVWIKSTVEGY